MDMRRIGIVGCLGILVCVGFAQAKWSPAKTKLTTPWTEKVSPDNCLPDYPRPLMKRDAWQNLNGLWDYAVLPKGDTTPETYTGKILVPFAIESALSGVGQSVEPNEVVWYRRSFNVARSWRKKRVLLHFGAVDWECTVWINGHRVGAHRGGYDAFSFDITDVLTSKATQELVVRVWDPTDADNATQARGKQVNHPHGIFYSAVTGIWQTVWIEPVSSTSIHHFRIVPKIEDDKAIIYTQVTGAKEGYKIKALATQGWLRRHRGQAAVGEPLELAITNPRLWTPDDPSLYRLKLTLINPQGKVVDEVVGHLGMRSIEVDMDHLGRQRLFLNGEPLFQFGVLDQGWWPDGLYTAPTDAALKYDIEQVKAFGYNMLRKHVKVEPQRFYYWCDKLGILVWQDMPSAKFNPKMLMPRELARRNRQFESEYEAMIQGLYNHPSIVMWIPFNEGWGQYDTIRITQKTKELDPTRLVNNASGWTDYKVGDVQDIHNYPEPGMPGLENDRAAVLGEFGGLGLALKGHTWQVEGHWGYRDLADKSALMEGYVKLVKSLYHLQEKGLSAAVYTQIADVEIETNGLMTYDRRVTKLAPKQVNALNRGYLSPDFSDGCETFLKEREVVLTSRDPYALIRYTLDGSEPLAISRLYEFPIEIDKDTTIKARCYWTDGTVSAVTTRHFKRVEDCQASLKIDVLNRGLHYEFFQGHWGQLPDFATMTPSKTGITNRMNLSALDEKANFALRCYGYIRIRHTGVYSFYILSDDGARLSIGDQVIVDNDGVHGMVQERGEIALEEGWHPVELLYFQGQGGLGLKIDYEGPRTTRQTIPASILGHRD